MSKGPHTFKQRDVTRAIKAARAAGVEAKVVIDRSGNISIIPKSEPEDSTPESGAGEWANAK